MNVEMFKRVKRKPARSESHLLCDKRLNVVGLQKRYLSAATPYSHL